MIVKTEEMLKMLREAKGDLSFQCANPHWWVHKTGPKFSMTYNCCDECPWETEEYDSLDAMIEDNEAWLQDDEWIVLPSK